MQWPWPGHGYARVLWWSPSLNLKPLPVMTITVWSARKQNHNVLDNEHILIVTSASKHGPWSSLCVQHLSYALLFIQTLILLKWNLTHHVDSVDTNNKSRVNTLVPKNFYMHTLANMQVDKYAGIFNSWKQSAHLLKQTWLQFYYFLVLLCSSRFVYCTSWLASGTRCINNLIIWMWWSFATVLFWVLFS